MKVKATRTDRVEVDVTPLEVFNALKMHLFSAYNIPLNGYIKDEKIIVDEEYHTSHSWFEERVVHANPSKDQLEVVNVVKSLASLINKQT